MKLTARKHVENFICCVIVLGSLCRGLSAADEPAAATQSDHENESIRRLSVHDVGEYAAVPWVAEGTKIVEGSRQDRVRDLNLSVASINLTDGMLSSQFAGYAESAKLAAQQGKKFLPRVDFWAGDRVQGSLKEVDVYWRRLDQFLAEMKSRQALDCFTGIVLSEENLHYQGRPAMLRELYQRVKAKYDVAVWQWWSPAKTVPGDGGWIPADGWVVDPYFVGRPVFRRYVRKYLITGAPLVIMPWATTSLGAQPMAPSQWQANSDQLDVAVEFNLPVAFFWTYGNGSGGGTSCNFGCDRRSQQAEIDRINQWVWDYIKRARSLPRDYTGAESADYGAGKVLEIGVTSAENRFEYIDRFANSRCVDDATMTGFRSLRLDGQSLSLVGGVDEPSRASLVYHFRAGFAAKSPQVSVTVDHTQQGSARLSISLDGKSWGPSAETNGNGIETLVVKTAGDSRYSAAEEFWVKLELVSEGESEAAAAVSVDDFLVSAEVQPPENAVVHLAANAEHPDRYLYEDHFETQRYRFSTKRTNDEQLEWQPGLIGVRMRPGGSDVSLIWRVVSDQPIRDVSVAVEGQANRGSLATNHFLDVSLDGKTWLHGEDTKETPFNNSGWARHGLAIDLSAANDFQGVREFFVRLRLQAGSYKEVHPYRSGVVNAFRIDARIAEPESR